MSDNKSNIKEWTTFWLFFFAYSFTAIITIIDFFVLRTVILQPIFILVFVIIFLAGFVLRLVCISQLGKFHTVHVKIREDHKIVRKGLYKYLRHPMYLSNLLIFIGGAGMFSSVYGLISTLLLILPVTVLRIKREEYYLANKFGKEYTDYSAATNRILPYIW